MSQIRTVGKFLAAIKTSDGSVVTPDEHGDVTLTATTYVFVFGPSDDSIRSLHLMTDGTIVLTSGNVEWSNLPRNTDETSTAPDDAATDYSTTAGHWVKDDSTTLAVANTSGTGWTVTSLTLSKTAGAGGAMLHLSGRGARRGRLNVVVATGGKMRVATHGKSA